MFSFHPEAGEESLDAVDYYESCEAGLGLDSANEVHNAIRSAVEYPRMWPEMAGEVRRCLVHRFPYGVLYCVEPQGVFILAVMHLHRDPGYWKHKRSGQP